MPFIGALVGAVASGAASSIFSDGSSGGGGGGGGSAPMSPLTGLLTGLGMSGIGPLSTQNLKDAASLADPFQSQRQQYQGPLSTLVQGMQGTLGQGPIGFNQAVGGAAPFAMSPGLSPMLQSMMNGQDPSYQFRYEQGLDALERQQAQTGNSLSGGAAIEAQKYGQDYASTEFNNVFSRQVQLQGLQDQQWAQQFQNLMSGASFGLASQGQNNQNSLMLGSLLANLAGVGASNPAVAGEITAGKYGQSQDNIANFLRSMGGLGLPNMSGGTPPNPFAGNGPWASGSDPLNVPFTYGTSSDGTLYGQYATDTFNNTNYFDPTGMSGGGGYGASYGFNSSNFSF